MRTCKHCNQPETEALTEKCPARVPGPPRPHEWTESTAAEDLRAQVLAVLRRAYPSALAQLALHCRDHGDHGDSFALATPEGTFEVPLDIVAECVQRELRRRFEKAADGRGKGT